MLDDDEYARCVYDGQRLQYHQNRWRNERSILLKRIEKLPAATIKKMVCLLFTMESTKDLTAIHATLEGMVDYEEDRRKKKWHSQL